MHNQQRIILVDDEPQVRAVLKHFLLRTLPAATVIEAANGQEALDLYDHGGADLIVTDNQMPVLDGLSLVQTLRVRHDLVPVVLVSGFLPPTSELARLGITSVLEKTDASRCLGEAVKRLLP